MLYIKDIKKLSKKEIEKKIDEEKIRLINASGDFRMIHIKNLTKLESVLEKL